MRPIKELLYIIALLSAGGLFGFFLAERALTLSRDLLASSANIDLAPLIENTLSSTQLAFVVLGLPLSVIAAILVQLAMRDPRGRLALFVALLGFAGVTAITFYFNAHRGSEPGSLAAFLNLARIIFAGISLVAIGYAFRANGREYYR